MNADEASTQMRQAIAKACPDASVVASVEPLIKVVEDALHRREELHRTCISLRADIDQLRAALEPRAAIIEPRIAPGREA